MYIKTILTTPVVAVAVVQVGQGPRSCLFCGVWPTHMLKISSLFTLLELFFWSMWALTNNMEWAYLGGGRTIADYYVTIVPRTTVHSLPSHMEFT